MTVLGSLGLWLLAASGATGAASPASGPSIEALPLQPKQGEIVIVTGPCTWTATSTVEWIRVTSAPSGAGSGVVQFTVLPAAGASRSSTIVIGAETFTVNQSR